MEDVLDVYAAPYDPAHPVVCFDESPKQLIGEVRDPEPPKPGTPARQDTEYQRNGVRDLMMICEPRRAACARCWPWRDAPESNLPIACGTLCSPTQTPRSFASSSTISIRTTRHRSTRPSRPKRLAPSHAGSNSITPQNTVVGSMARSLPSGDHRNRIGGSVEHMAVAANPGRGVTTQTHHRKCPGTKRHKNTRQMEIHYPGCTA